MIVRKENPGDIEAIRHVNEMAFGGPSEADLVDALRRHGKVTISLVAEEDSQIVGHILFSPVTLEPGINAFAAVGLAPLAVLPQFQNQGIGSLLVVAGLEQCRAAGIDWVVVLGHPSYYPRFGFVPASRFGVKCVYNVSDETFMLLELREGIMKGHSGIVNYQPQFNEV
ncbi:MAG: N-acetyltransferase [Acidobacteria bacterium]|nr:N-acetyltransferase [Acidobacteriota bacterium]